MRLTFSLAGEKLGAGGPGRNGNQPPHLTNLAVRKILVAGFNLAKKYNSTCLNNYPILASFRYFVKPL
jgi:hypothetical protein